MSCTNEHRQTGYSLTCTLIPCTWCDTFVVALVYYNSSVNFESNHEPLDASKKETKRW